MPTIILVIGGVLILIMLIAGVVITISSESSLVEERIGSFLDDTAKAELEFGSSEEAVEEGPSALTSWLNNLVAGSDFGGKIGENLAKADIKFKPGEYVALIVISSFASGVLGFFFGGGLEAGIVAYILMLAGFVGGYFLPGMYVKNRQAARLKNFGDQLPDMLNLMVNGLRAGFSTMQALEAVGKEMPNPINSEFRRVVQEMQLGITMDDALENLVRRIPSEDLDLVITAINVQREVGGNLSEILETISHTIRERIRIKGEIKSLTAQVVYSGRFLSMMPVFLSFILFAINRDYMMQFFLEPVYCGVGMLTCGGIMIFIGYVIMAKIADIEI